MKASEKANRELLREGRLCSSVTANKDATWHIELFVVSPANRDRVLLDPDALRKLLGVDTRKNTWTHRVGPADKLAKRLLRDAIGVRARLLTDGWEVHEDEV